MEMNRLHDHGADDYIQDLDWNRMDFPEQNTVYVIGKRNMVMLDLSFCPRYPQEQAGKKKEKKLLTMEILITPLTKITRQMKTKKQIISNQNFELQTLGVRAARGRLKTCHPSLLFINLFYTRNESMTVPALALYDKTKCI